MSFEVKLKKAMKNMLVNRGVDAEQVVGWTDRTVYSGGCSTCAFEYAVVDIEYVTLMGSIRTYEYDGDFGQLIRELT